MSQISFEDSDYATPDSIDQKIALSADPFIGELYHHLTEDYRYWGNQSRFNNFQSYFEMIRHREIHRLYTRSPVNEFIDVIEQPGEREAWTVLPHMDKFGNAHTAYPPGLIPPNFEAFNPSDELELSPHDELVQEEGSIDKVFRDVYNFTKERELADQEAMDEYMDRIQEVHAPYLRGEAIVPDLTTRIPKPALMNQGNPLSRYSALDQVAIDTIFKPERPIGDLSVIERAKAAVVESHMTPDWTTRTADRAAAWGEQVALRSLYERALYANHVASLVSLEQGKQMPSPPLPDPRLSRESLADARKRFSTRLATLNELNYPIHDTSDPVARQKYQASIGAYVVAGQESGFLPADIDKLPKIFRASLEALRRADFIVERDKALALAKKGHEEMMRLRQEVLTDAESNIPRFVDVHWSGPDARYAHVPSDDLWKRIPKNAESSSTIASSAPSATIATSEATTATVAATTSPTAPSTAVAEPALNKYFSSSLNEFDWAAFNKDVYSPDMTPAEFDVACEAMLHAIDLQHQASLPALSLEAQRAEFNSDYASLTPTERLAQRNHNLQLGMTEFAAANPRPLLLKKITRESYELYEERMSLWLKERERTMRRLVKENPVNIALTKESLTAMGLVAKDPVSGEERVATWSELLVQKTDAEAVEFYQNFLEFLQRDTASELSLDEVHAFAAQHQNRLGMLGLSGSTDAMRASFVETFMPLSSLSPQAILDIYGEDIVENRMFPIMDKRHRYLRAQHMSDQIEQQLKISPTSKLPHRLALQKTTKELEQARRAAVNDQKQLLFETLLMQSAEEAEKTEQRLLALIRNVKSDFEMRLQYRNYMIITTDPELKYMSAPQQISAIPEHVPLPRYARWPFRILTWLQRYLIHKPIYHATLAYNSVASYFSFERSMLARWLVKRSGLDLVTWKSDSIGLDPKTAHFYHPYYRQTLYRLYYFLHAPETANLSITERSVASSPSLPSWAEYRIQRWRTRWTNRISSFVSTPSRFMLLPVVAMVTVATVAMLEQRNTWAHDIIRAKPEGFEVSSDDRRRWMLRSIPSWSKQGPRPIWYGVQHQPLDHQDAPYLHRANSSNAADFRVIGD